MKLGQCRIAITTYQDAKRFCYEKGERGQLYFDDMWEHCHNSRNFCFSYIQKTVDTMNKLVSTLNIEDNPCKN